MSQSFGAGLDRLCALAARYLGWRPGDFWTATPDELHACLSDPAMRAARPVTRADIQQLLERESDG